MARSLVIVESPAKASTLGKFLGRDFQVAACFGHVRDLEKKGIAVDRANNYEPNYRIVPGKERTVAELARLARKSDRIFLAADPDREGEAICWHLHELLKKEAPKAEFHRAEFHEITKSAVTRAIENPGKISKDRVGAQQARRIIDRLVGYEVSELLWNKVWRGLSAGRVQTVALRIIVERESERERFVPVPYFSVPVTLAKDGTAFPARVVVWRGDKLQFDGTDPRLATARGGRGGAGARRALRRCGSSSVEARERRQNPAPPFTTPKLQQAAARSLGFSVRKTMTLAQRLYEGKAIGEPGHRRPHHLHEDRLRPRRRRGARRRARAHPRDLRRGGAPRGAAPLQAEEGRAGRARGDPADDAGAAARGGRALRGARRAQALPPDLEPVRRLADEPRGERGDDGRDRGPAAGLARPRRSCAPRAPCSGTPGSCASTARCRRPRSAERARGGGARATTSKVRLPALAEGDAPELREARAEGHETQPPPRFNEASLVKFMEENGIGRPSTYADILRKIEQREYVHKKDRRFIPTPLGRLVVDLMKEGFEDFFQTEYTARMEEELDEVEEGKVDWRQALRDFDGKFSKDRERAKKQMHSVKAGLEMPLVRAAFTDFKLTERPRRHVPGERPPAEAADGQGGALHRVQRLPGLHLHRGHPGDGRGPDGPERARGPDLRGVRQPDAPAHGQERLGLPRLHRVPEVPQRDLGRDPGGQGGGAAGRAHRREAARCAGTTS